MASQPGGRFFAAARWSTDRLGLTVLRGVAMIVKKRRVLIAAQYQPEAAQPPTPDEIRAVQLAWAQAAAYPGNSKGFGYGTLSYLRTKHKVMTTTSAAALIQVRAGLADLVGLEVAALSDEEARAGVLGLLAARNQVNAVLLALVASFDARDLAEADGFRTTRVWLSGFGRLSPHAATETLRKARLLRGLPGLAARAGAGEISDEHLGKLARLVTDVGLGPVSRVEQILTDLAATATPAALGRACDRIRAHIDPDGPDPAQDFDRRALSIARVGGMVAIRGQLDLDGGAALLTALDALTPPPGPAEERSAAQRRADALVELCRLPLTAATLPTTGGIRPHIGILIPATTLTQPPPDPDDSGPRPATPENREHSGGDPPATPASPGGVHRPPAAPETASTQAAGRPRPRPLRKTASTPPSPPSATGSPPPATHPYPNPVGWTGSATSPPPPPNASPATPPSGASSSTPPPANPSTSAAPTAPPHPGSAAPCTPATAAAAGPAAPPPPPVRRPPPAHWIHGGQTNTDQMILLCRWHHARVHEHRWRIHHNPTTAEITITRPDGRAYELGPTHPYPSPYPSPRPQAS